MSLEGSRRRGPDPNPLSQRRGPPPTTPPPRRAAWAATSSRRAARLQRLRAGGHRRGEQSTESVSHAPPVHPRAFKHPPTNPVVRFSPILSLWAHPAPRVASASRSEDSGAARTPGSPAPQAGSSFVSPEPRPRGRSGTGPRGRGRRLLLPAQGARGRGPDDNENSQPRRRPGPEPREPRVGAGPSSPRPPGAEDPGRAAAYRRGPPRRRAREPPVRFAEPLPAPRAVVPAPEPPAHFGNEISFLVLRAPPPRGCDPGRGAAEAVSPRLSVPICEMGPDAPGRPARGFACGRRKAGVTEGARRGPRAMRLSGPGCAVGLRGGAGRGGAPGCR